jgi:hypothetical protein
MPIISAGYGFLMLVAGRPFYSVFAGGVGFLVGNFLVEQYPFLSPFSWHPFVMPLIVSLVFGALTFLFKRWVARVCGFFAGGYILYRLPVALGAQTSWGSPVLFAIIGAICFVLLLVWFDFALIALSSLSGTSMILQALRTGALDPIALFLILLVFGLITQFLLMQYIRPTPD